MKRTSSRNRYRLWIGIIIFALFATSSFPDGPAFADTPGEVTVALFIKSNDYAAAASSVTLSADGGLTLSDGGESGGEWLRTADDAPVRVTVDGYAVLVGETADETKAASLAAAVRKAKQSVAVFTRTVKGKAFYRIEAGPYGTKAEADAARLTVGSGTVTGTYDAVAGTYASEADALAAAGALWDAGVYAFTALTRNSAGTAQYELRVGRAVDEASLQQAVAAASAAVPGLALAPAPRSVPYVALRSDRAGEAGLMSAVRHAAAGGDGAKLAVRPTRADSPIRVAERFGRSYRGAVELSRYNDALAVVNRVGLEAYVASVVGSELDVSWPKEVLKAQAVASRTYVLKQGWKYGIAQVADSTADQAYRGVEREFPAIVQAVQETAGERLVGANGVLLDAFYHSNGGGRTADPSEVWSGPVAGIGSVPSPDDAAERNKLEWYRIVMPDGQIGYVRSDLVRLSGEFNAAGYPLGKVSDTNVNVREAPYVNNDTNPSIGQLAQGTAVTVIGRDMESTAYQWIRGPYGADEVLQQMVAGGISVPSVPASGRLQSVQVISRGQISGRVTGIAVNGQAVTVARTEQYRTMFGLPSTRYEVEETARVTVLGASGRATESPASAGGTSLTLLGAGGKKQVKSSGAYLISDGSETARVATVEPGFRFLGTGYGHGLGMSQWGAFGLSELGYDYRKILLYYYKDATIAKE